MYLKYICKRFVLIFDSDMDVEPEPEDRPNLEATAGGHFDFGFTPALAPRDVEWGCHSTEDSFSGKCKSARPPMDDETREGLEQLREELGPSCFTEDVRQRIERGERA